MVGMGDNLNTSSRVGRKAIASTIAACLLFAVVPAIAQDEQPARESPQPQGAVTPANPTPSVATADVTSTSSAPGKPAPVTTTGPAKPAASPITEQSEPGKALPSPSQEASPEKAAPAPKKPSKPRIVVVSWAGAYGDAQKQAIIDPLARDLDIDIERRTHDSSASAIDADVMEQDQSSLIAACAAGRFVKIGSLLSPAERSEIATNDAGGDFLANSISD